MKAQPIYHHWLKCTYAPDADSDIRAHLERLHDAARGTVVELGLDRGVSTAALLAGVELHGGTVLSIDISGFCPAISQLDGHPQWAFMQARSLQAEMPESIDVLLIDSSHEYPATLLELSRWFPRMAPGGVVFLHDTDNPIYPGVRQSIEEFLAGHPSLSCRYHSGSFGMAEIREIR